MNNQDRYSIKELIALGLLFNDTFFLRDNVWAYVTALYVAVIGRSAFDLLFGTASAPLQVHGAILAILLFAPLAWYALLRKTMKNT